MAVVSEMKQDSRQIPKFLAIALALVALWVVAGRLYATWKQPPEVGQNRFTERLGLAGAYCGPLPGDLQDVLKNTAVAVESEPEARKVLSGKASSQESKLSTGLRLRSMALRTPGSVPDQQIQDLAYQGLLKVLGSFWGVTVLCILVAAAPWVQSAEDEPPGEWPSKPTAWTALGLFSCWVLADALSLGLAHRYLWGRLTPFELLMLLQIFSYAVGLGLLAWFWRWESWKPWKGLRLDVVAKGYFALLVLMPTIEWLVHKVTGVAPHMMLSLMPYFRGLSPGQAAVLIVIATVVGPVFEELLNRGWLLQGLSRGGHPVRGVVLSAALFALLHGNVWVLPGAFVFGLVTGAVAYRTKTLASSTAVHMLWNITTLIVMYACL